MEPGIDIKGQIRPKGFTWDMGAFETSSFKDADEDGLPDSWEERIIASYNEYGSIYDVLPGDDADGDLISNLEEFRNGSDPTVPVYIAVTNPSVSPYLTDEKTLEIELYTVNASKVTVSTGMVTNHGDGTWSVAISLNSGSNVVLLTATGTVNNESYQATDSLTIIRDSAPPTVTITSPTTGVNYSTALESITIGGFAGDDTPDRYVSWSKWR